ncbi:hypothetical protein SSP24_75050 [Streptomyces spinoverrucosus]|uniref:Uncharacterized protein n=1 Tax=Streptomyces spinoverrucosus TaxID=284043 RepID=A0A4Y3VW24_9ACTN|nr:hypothetical protein SSP24_75050 [Streptomyces spinoverrucosus]GHB97352.1 hypothetical protein GCM10010397_82380 [Streptomyces spinoverrucosus]
MLAYGAGWRAPATELPKGVPYARGAAPDSPPAAYLVYLDGIGKRRVRDSRDGGQLVKALLAGAPELRVLGQVQPYSPLADPLAERPVWAWLRRRVGLLLFLHNVMQIFVAADHRYRRLYNRAVGRQIATQLRLAGYEPDSGVPVVLLSYSGGAQVAGGAVGELHAQLRSPLLLITLGGFHNGANDFTRAEHHMLIRWIERPWQEVEILNRPVVGFRGPGVSASEVEVAFEGPVPEDAVAWFGWSNGVEYHPGRIQDDAALVLGEFFVPLLLPALPMS